MSRMGGQLIRSDFRSQSGSHQSSASSQNPKWSRVSVAKILVQNILDPINVFGLKYLTWPLDTVHTCTKKSSEIVETIQDTNQSLPRHDQLQKKHSPSQLNLVVGLVRFLAIAALLALHPFRKHQEMALKQTSDPED